MNGVVFDEALKKKMYSFDGDINEVLDAAKIDSIVVMEVKNDQNQARTLKFRVTRDARLGSWQRWIYGRLLDTGPDEYYQVEIRLHKNNPEYDSIAVCLQAPPAMLK